MKADILNLDGKKVKTIDLPIQFSEPYRPDLIKKAVLTIQSNSRQQYGAMYHAGMKYSAKLSRRRRDYKTSYGRGMSRVPRKTLTRRGLNFYWVGAVAPGTVGGRRAHPPKSEKIFSKRMNRKEKRKAIRSAISATLNKDLVAERGHIFKEIPLIIEDKFESLNKAKNVKGVLIKIGLDGELKRTENKKVRAGKGKNRGRKYRIKKGPLIIVSGDCNLIKSAKNILGVDIIKVKELNTELLAPGCMPARLCIWSEKAIGKMGKEKLFLDKEK
jgi:large subunit ribosomal protein L4e